MGYFKIDEHRVFYSEDRFAGINQQFFEQLTAQELIDRSIMDEGSYRGYNRKLQELRISKLREDFQNLSGKQFHYKWVQFEFRDKDARQLSMDILHDYFDINQNGYLEEIPNFETAASDERLAISTTILQGRIVKLHFNIAAGKGILSRLFRPNKTLTKMIDLYRIRMIRGSLKTLEIRTDKDILKLGDEIEIIDYATF